MVAEYGPAMDLDQCLNRLECCHEIVDTAAAYMLEGRVAEAYRMLAEMLVYHGYWKKSDQKNIEDAHSIPVFISKS